MLNLKPPAQYRWLGLHLSVVEVPVDLLRLVEEVQHLDTSDLQSVPGSTIDLGVIVRALSFFLSSVFCRSNIFP